MGRGSAVGTHKNRNTVGSMSWSIGRIRSNHLVQEKKALVISGGRLVVHQAIPSFEPIGQCKAQMTKVPFDCCAELIIPITSST